MNAGTVQDGGVNVAFGMRPAECLCEGDSVLIARDPSPRLAKVLARRTGFAEGFVQLLLEDDVVIKTPRRQMLTGDGGAVDADAVPPGMSLKCLDGSSRRVVGAAVRPYLLFVVELAVAGGLYGVEGVEFVCAG